MIILYVKGNSIVSDDRDYRKLTKKELKKLKGKTPVVRKGYKPYKCK